jgi:hypothetical protein
MSRCFVWLVLAGSSLACGRGSFGSMGAMGGIGPSGNGGTGTGGDSGSGGTGGGGSGGSGTGGSGTGGSSTGGGSGSGAGGTGQSGAGGMSAGRSDASAPVVADPCVAANTCPLGTWVRHELPGFGGPDTVQTVLADPARPGDFYAFVGSNNGGTVKVYRSTDYGNTWENRNRTAEFKGNPWGASIDPGADRDPNTPPTMWSPSGYGANGAWKSTDGGQTFVRADAADKAFAAVNPFGPTATDLYHVKILPDDPPNHVLATYHYGFRDKQDGGFGETWDGGATWVIHQPPTNVGTSHYVIPISGTTWAVIAQDNGGKNGIWRTTSAGRMGGSAANKFRDGTISPSAWAKVDTLEHAHGAHENVVLANGTILASGLTNGARSTDGGATWQHFTNGSWGPPHQFEMSGISNLAVTDRFVYTNFLMNPSLARAPKDDPIGPEKWDLGYCQTPAGMKTGGAPFGMASVYDAVNKHWVIIAGANDSGLWKFVEP